MSGDMNVPKQVLVVLPCDSFEQIDIARKITSIALSTRVSSLESESSILQQHIAARDDVIVDFELKLHSLDFSLSQDLHNLSLADHQKENLLKENAWLLETINKLKRDVAKLETFRKTLMMSLQDEEGILSRGSPEYEESTSSMQSHSSDVRISYHDEHVTDASRPRISQSLLFAHSFSAAPTSGTFNDRSSVYSSANSSPYVSMTGRTRFDSKEFFRQVRSRLAYEQFAAFLAKLYINLTINVSTYV
nr:putative WAT1-related protein [Tanacetum cinerariifolium]